jgi:hypothetical protein
MAGAQRGLHRLKSDAAAGANDEKFGHFRSRASAGMDAVCVP